jgi:hypothetical protein
MKTNKILLGYIHLCTAIIQSGIDCNDTFFLNSEWYKTLVAAVESYYYAPNRGKDTFTILGGNK